MTESSGVNSPTEAMDRIQRMRQEIARVVVGQQGVIDQVLMALLASGHVLVEGELRAGRPEGEHLLPLPAEGPVRREGVHKSSERTC